MSNKMLINALCAATVGCASTHLAHAERQRDRNEAAVATASASELSPNLVTWERSRPLERPNTSRPTRSTVLGVPVQVYMSLNHRPEGDGPTDLVYTPDGSQVLVVHRTTGNVVFFDAGSQQAIDAVDVGEFPLSIAVTPNGQYALTANAFSDSVSVIDIATRTVVAHVPVTGAQPYRVRVTADSNYAVVGVINTGSDATYSIIDLDTLSEVLTFPGGSQGQYGGFFTPESGIQGPLLTEFELTPDGNRIVQPDRSNNMVRIYDRATGQIIQNLPVSNNPTRVAISTDGTLAVVQHDSNGNGLTRVNLTNNTVEAFFPVPGIGSRPVLITPDKNYAISGSSNDTIFVNLTTGTVDTSVFTGAVFGLAMSHDGQYAFVANVNARVFDIPSRSLVATMPFAACVESVASPIENKVAALNSRFREDIHFYNIDGANGAFEGFASSGMPPEADAPRAVAVTPDGAVAVVTNIVSRNVSIVDITGTDPVVRSYIDVGERPLHVAVTPDGQYAVVAASDANMVRIIDLSTDQIVSSIPISARPTKVLISADSQTAYVLNVTSGDKVTFINLDGANSSIISQLPSGVVGSHAGYTFTQFSGMTLSPDGSLLAVAASFDNQVRLFDTATRTHIATVPTGTYPIRVTFTPDGSRAYVACANGHVVSVIEVDGANSFLAGNITGIFRPLVMLMDATGEYLYVGNTSLNQNDPWLYVISTQTNSIVASIALPSNLRDGHINHSEGRIYAVTSEPGILYVFDAAGPSTSVLETYPLTSAPAAMVFNQATKTAVISQTLPDGMEFVFFDPQPQEPCPADLNRDGAVDVSDLLELLGAWGECAGCAADFNDDGVVDVTDLLQLLGAWGPC